MHGASGGLGVMLNMILAVWESPLTQVQAPRAEGSGLSLLTAAPPGPRIAPRRHSQKILTEQMSELVNEPSMNNGVKEPFSM